MYVDETQKLGGIRGFIAFHFVFYCILYDVLSTVCGVQSTIYGLLHDPQISMQSEDPRFRNIVTGCCEFPLCRYTCNIQNMYLCKAMQSPCTVCMYIHECTQTHRHIHNTHTGNTNSGQWNCSVVIASSSGLSLSERIITLDLVAGKWRES